MKTGGRREADSGFWCGWGGRDVPSCPAAVPGACIRVGCRKAAGGVKASVLRGALPLARGPPAGRGPWLRLGV